MPVSVDHIVDALASLGGRAHLDDIVRRVTEISPPPLPQDIGASVRARIQERCKEAKSYKGGEDIFFSVHGVAARQGWWGLRDDPLSVASPDGFQDGADAFMEEEEGKARLRIHLRRERSQKLVLAFKSSLVEIKCCVCEFDFEKVYREHGRGYIEAHHTIPISKLEEGGTTSIKDLVPLCANCHRIIHRNNLIAWYDLKKIVNLTR